MEYPVTVVLQHTSVGVEARVVEFSDFLSKKLNAIRRIAEDDGLIDLESGKERVKAMNFLLLVDIAIVLCDPPES